MRGKCITLALFLGLSLGMALAEEPVAVVVQTNNPVNSISMSNLREMFQCDRSAWPSGTRVKLFSRGVGTPEHNSMVRVLYHSSENEYNQMWVMKQIRGETSCKPTELPSKGMTIEALRAFPGALALIRLSEVTPEMKIVSVDGKKPDSPDYPLR